MAAALSDSTPTPLDHIEVILVGPRGPRNVGQTARAMANFGLSLLTVVDGVDPLHPESVEMAVRGRDILERCRQVQTLDQALDAATYVVATTAKRRYRLPTTRPREAASLIVQHARTGRVALLFGREDHGLSDPELRRAHATIAIETAPTCRALNISQAVLLVAYEIWGAADVPGIVAESDQGRLMSGQMRARLEAELLSGMRTIGLLHEGNAEACRQSIERLLSLGPIQSRDARMLFALARRLHDHSESEQPPR